MFKIYPKIFSLINNEETEGILNGLCYIQEKIDGANLSVWLEDGEIFVGSRTQVVGTNIIKEGFRGAVEYINTHEGIKALLGTLEGEIRLYGEWLVPHTITNYNSLSYNHFYLFDIEINNIKLNPKEVYDIAIKYNIYTPEIFAIINKPKEEEVLQYVGKTTLKKEGTGGEGIVIKNMDFINKWGRSTYAKVVAENFKESNAIVFGNHQKGDIEMKLCNKYCNIARVRKIMNKIEQQQDKNISKVDIKQIIGRLQNDIIVEEAWDISKEGIIDFGRLKGLIAKRGAKISIDIIEGNLESIAMQ